ncbi:MAG: translation factor Sua5, partial [Clostridiales bacterium]|nr:translation factor Sua5 [Clostridiales bacterium]
MKTLIIEQGGDLDAAVRAIFRGDVTAVLTETVYGLAAVVQNR